MRKVIRKFFCVLTAVTVMLGGLQAPAAVQAQESGQQTGLSTLAGEDGVVVSTRDEFMNALKQRQSPITVSKLISIGEEAGADKRMLPVIIPGNTLIRAANGGAISSRGPIQLEGDGVCFQNIKLSFTSSSALGSVPHREIFLAGHSLTLDNVNTYLEGEPGLGALGGGEKELLPTVYAGGFSDTAVGQNASLTVKNSNDETMFQAIYMGNGKGTDNNVPYYGSAVLNLDAKVIVREGVDTVLNSQAEITISSQADKTVKVKDIYGNDNTTLTLSQGAMENAIVEDVGSIVLKDSACMSPVTQQFKNVTLVNGACLDLNGAGNAVLTGNFSGVEDPAAKRGILVLNPEGSLTIAGKVTGTTQFQTVNRLFPGWLLPGKTYIYAENGSGTEPNFILAQKSIDYGFELGYETDGWKVNGGQIDSSEIGHIEIVSAPSKVDLRKIPSQEDESIPDENVYFEVKWYDLKGEVFSDTDVLQEYGFYEGNYVVKIRTDYWKNDSDEVLDKTDWYQSIWLLASEEHPGRYYLEAFEGATPGDYTFLFCSEPFETLNTVADVKALKSTVMAEKRVIFYDQDQEEPDEPEHTHTYQGTVTTEPACTEAGVKTFVCECGEKYTEKIPALGHKAVTDPRVEPTETEPGKTEGSHCSVCEEILIAQETIPATGKPGEHQHNYQSEVTKEASCTEAGVKTFVCECGEKYTEKIPALGHKAVTDPRVEPTETEPGKTEGSHCSVCEEILIAQETIPATGKPGEHQHNYQSEVMKEASCTEAGVKTFVCECGEKYTEKIPALGHKAVTDPRVEPTETEPGKTEGSHCSVCEEILIAQETIPATGKPGEHQHNYQSEMTKEASCTETGVKTFVCECGEKYTETIPALGHKAVTDPRVEPTETEPGKTEGSHCSVCEEILIAQETIPATGKPGEHQHNYQSEVTKEASCTEAGIRTYSCICGEQYTEQIAALSHQYVEKCIPATLRDSGVIQQICRNCSDVQQSVVIDSPRKGIISKTDFTYDGKVKTPSAVVKDSKGKSLTEGTDYRVIYSKGRKNPGIYAVTIEFQGKYSGEFTENFTIRPKKTSLKKVSAKSRGIQVVWKKQTTQTDGYEIQYCTSGNFKGKTLKKATVKKGATAKKISGLKGKKKYYVRIRTYKTVRVDGKNKKLYSDWSGKKTVRTKR